MTKAKQISRHEVREAYERVNPQHREERGLPALSVDDEAWAAALLQEWVGARTELQNGATVSVLNIITNEPMTEFAKRSSFQETFGRTNPSDPEAIKKPRFNRIEPVAEIEVQDDPGFTRLIEWPDGTLGKVRVVRYIASSAVYAMPDGRQCSDSCSSGPEQFVRDGDGQFAGQIGAATALLRRLTEAVALS